MNGVAEGLEKLKLIEAFANTYVAGLIWNSDLKSGSKELDVVAKPGYEDGLKKLFESGVTEEELKKYFMLRLSEKYEVIR